MDIDFIEEKDRDNVFKLMQICGVQMQQAYQLYLNANNSFETAMHNHFNGGANFQSNPSQQQHSSFSGVSGGHQNQVANEDFETLYLMYRTFREREVKFGDRYEIRKSSSFLGNIGKSLVPSFWNKQEQSNFKKMVENYLGRTIAVKFSATSLSCTLAESDTFPVLVSILDLSPSVKAKVDQVYRNENFKQVANVQFKHFGLDPKYEIEKSLEKFVDRTKYNNHIVVLRVNIMNQVETIDQISIINSSTKQILERLKRVKSSCISKDHDEAYLQKRYEQQLMGNFDFQKPVSMAEKKKIAQDRNIRKIQEEEFYASMKAHQEKQRKNSEAKQAQEVKKTHEPKRNFAEQRENLRKQMKIYTQGMSIKLRLPNGESIRLIVSPQQRVQYIYDFVESIQNQIGFEKENSRKFDILRPYDRLNLSERRQEVLNIVFEGSDSEALVVRQRE